MYCDKYQIYHFGVSTRISNNLLENQPINQQPFYQQQQGISVLPDSSVIIQNLHSPAQIIPNQQPISIEQSHQPTFVQSPYLLETNAPTSIHPLIPDSSINVEGGDYIESKRLKLSGVLYYRIF